MKNLHLLLLSAGLLACGSVVLAETPAPAAAHHGEKAPSVTAEEALKRLEEGNKRYVEGALAHPHQDGGRRTEVAGGQAPFAIVLGCADSRVSPEVLFDQGLGDLFVVRVAGNVVDDHVLGSIEYAVEHLGAKLVVVLGHERCGAVKAAKETIAAKATAGGHVGSLVEAIAPAVEETTGGDLDATIHANVANVAEELAESGPVIKGVTVRGAYYDLDTGTVVFDK